VCGQWKLNGTEPRESERGRERRAIVEVGTGEEQSDSESRNRKPEAGRSGITGGRGAGAATGSPNHVFE